MSGTVAIVGAGLVGSSWATLFASRGWTVRVHDARPEAAGAALDACSGWLRDLEEAGLIGVAPAALARVRVAPDLPSAVEGADFVQESGPEDLGAKRELIADIDRLTPRGAVIASSTSGLPASSWSEPLPGRDRCLVGHPVNPPHLVPLVEVVPGRWTTPEAVKSAANVYRAVGQTPIILRREVPGFVLNRLQAALLAEAFRLVRDGVASPSDVDACVADGLGRRWAFMGPFATIALNAPGGIPDYVERFRGFLDAVTRDPAPPDVFDRLSVERIGTGLERRPTVDALRARDRALLALREAVARRMDPPVLP